MITAAAVLWLWRDRILFCLAPKYVLVNAFSDTCVHLEKRWEKSFLYVMKNYIDPKGNYCATGTFQIPHKLLDIVDADVNLQINSENHQIAANGTIQASGQPLDISVYLDHAFLAANLKEITQNQFYGITYATFLQDIQNIPLVHYFIPEDTLQDWDRSLQQLRMQMNWNTLKLNLMSFSGKEIEQLRLGLLMLPCGIEKRAVNSGGIVLDCHALSYKISEDMVKSYFPAHSFLKEGDMDVIFYLFENRLIKIKLQHNNSLDSLEIDLLENPEENILVRYTNSTFTGDFSAFSLEFTESSEVWKFSKNEEMLEASIQYYDFNNAWKLSLKGTNIQSELILQETANGLYCQTDSLIVDGLKLRNLSVAIEPGTNITIPQYYNLDKWTMDDLWNILIHTGELIGLPMIS